LQSADVHGTPVAASLAQEDDAMQLGPMATVLVLLVGLLVIVGVGVKLYDLRRSREAQAVHLQAQVSDALLRDANLFGLAVTPTVHVPWWSGTPAHLEVTGRVPDGYEQQRVLQLVEREARQIRSDVVIEDRLDIDESVRVRAA
jgi:hypothetical protein